MDSPGYIILSRLALQSRATQVLAHNLANADTPGFRALRPVFGEVIQRQELGGSPPGGRPVAFVQDRATWREMDLGAMQVTGNPLDVAITGEGFFAVETPRGERYTRGGRFSLGEGGRLVDMEGNAVLTAEGAPIAFSPNDTRIEIQGDGTVRSENGVLGRLRVVRFDNPQALRAEGDRVFDAAGADPVAVERPALRQGVLEGSNVRPIIEMTRLTAELREFQFAAQFAEKEGERLSTAVERILRRRS
ncbi:flagellar basal-body rod protein FlgF [Roseomonas sp. CECT 9278]|uniref:flagellar basal-body rod protein FlgF n=1 Tax=Roseomonas sp. CECT 9278 TaxID=2845823 RepID=UPI001E2EC147|nr:flagellar basal-body rod protein FlgF [Roseomonas sp. CECT 9278]CAH0142160.1 Flagellar basal-body rod protein FlgF [Roseomonas sp. CECT 9278]